MRVLSRVFRGKLLQAFERSSCRHGAGGTAILRQAASQPWVVYSKPPMAGPQQVLRYLGRYTHRIAIGNERLVSISRARSPFAIGIGAVETGRILTVDALDFVRRFLLHVLPQRFVRLRHFGLFANRSADRTRLPQCPSQARRAQPSRSHSQLPAESWQGALSSVSPGVSRIQLSGLRLPERSGLWPPLPALALRSRAADHEHDPPPIACRPERQTTGPVCERLLPPRTTIVRPPHAPRPQGALSISFLGSLCSSRWPDASPLSRPSVESPYRAEDAA